MSGPSATERGFRSLADQLRSWPDSRVAQLLRARPDLATPAPQDSGQLASRAATRPSLLRALDQLTRAELWVLDALVVAVQTTPEELVELVNADEDVVRAALRRLCDLALVWESRQGLRALSGVADGLRGGPEEGVSGLRPFSADPLTPQEVQRRLAQVSPAARRLLDHVAEHGGEATTGTSRHTVLPEEADTPAEELLSRRLLVPRAGGLVVLPGEVGVVLRGGRTWPEPIGRAPELAVSTKDPAQVDRTAAGAALEMVRRTELVLDHWGTAPPAALRSGGLSVRDLRATATWLHVDEPTVALVVEVASAAGLLAMGSDARGTPAWLPTDAFDRWVAEPVAARWLTLVRAWEESPRMPGLVGSRDGSGKAWNALAPELAGVHVVESRRMTLAALAELAPGEVLATGTGLPSLLARVAWRRPRRPRARDEQVAWTIAEAATLGLTGLGGPASYTRALVAGEDPVPGLTGLLPEPVDHVLLQADLTAVAPGPLEASLARRLQLVADVESRGGATTYRFSPASVRRALDGGWSAAELHDFLAEVSRTPVPQPLTYLVDDTARTFGQVRVGHAEAFLRADDEATLTELLHHPQTGSLGLRRIAPTVVITDTPLDVLLPRLRDLGAAPVVEAPDGTVRVARPDSRRARTPRDHRGAAAQDARETARIAAVVTALRSGDRAAEHRPTSAEDRAGAAHTPGTSLAALREAIETRAAVLIGYVDNHGANSERIVEPVAVEGGRLTAYDHRSDDTRTFAVHRITAVRPLPAEA